jgi:hypothetical protein
MTQPFYCTKPDARGEYDEYFVDHAGTYIVRERIRDLGRAFTLRTDILPTNTFLRSFWSVEAKNELAVILAAADAMALGTQRGGASANQLELFLRRAKCRAGKKDEVAN